MESTKTVKLSADIYQTMLDMNCSMLVCTRSWKILTGHLGKDRLQHVNRTGAVFNLLAKHGIDLKCDVFAVSDPKAAISALKLLGLEGTVAVMVLGATKKESKGYLNYNNLKGFFKEEVIQYKGETLMVVYVSADYPADQLILVSPMPDIEGLDYERRRMRINQFMRQVQYELLASPDVMPYAPPEGVTIFGCYSQVKYLKHLKKNL